jgi:hypothetical protein
MVWLLEQSGKRRSFEVRLAFEGDGYELVIDDGSTVHVEQFMLLAPLLRRQEELLSAWKALGWTEPADRRTESPS